MKVPMKVTWRWMREHLGKIVIKSKEFPRFVIIPVNVDVVEPLNRKESKKRIGYVFTVQHVSELYYLELRRLNEVLQKKESEIVEINSNQLDVYRKWVLKNG